MKSLFFSIVFLSFVNVSSAQTAVAEVKAAYLLAEEAYASNDYKNALDYLEQCKSKMGRPNSKILYLQIMSEIELANNDPAYYDKALATIGAFEKAPDIEQFNEEKTLEVMKTKLRIKKLKEANDLKAAEVRKQMQAAEQKAAYYRTLGGMVVYEKDGHGLVVATEDLGKMSWKKAKQTCDSLVLNGHDDWYLPTPDDFKLIYDNVYKTGRGTFMVKGASTYWTSKDGGMLGWFYDFKNNQANTQGKFLNGYVRPVRTF